MHFFSMICLLFYGISALFRLLAPRSDKKSHGGLKHELCSLWLTVLSVCSLLDLSSGVREFLRVLDICFSYRPISHNCIKRGTTV